MAESRFRLRYLLAVMLVVMTLLPVLVNLAYHYHYTSKQLEKHLEDKLAAISLTAKKRILSASERIRDNSRLIASRTRMSKLIREWDIQPSESVKEQLNQILFDAQTNLSVIRRISLFDINGEMIVSTGLERDILDESEQSIADIDIRMVKRQDVVVQSIKRLEEQGATTGYLLVETSAGFLQELINDRAGLGVTGEWLFAVRNDDGDAVFAIPLKYDRSAAMTRIVSRDRLDVPITQALLGNEIIMRNAPDYIDVPVMASTRYIPELDWGLVAKINEDEIQRWLQETNRYSLLLGIIMIVLAILIALVLSLLISRPLERLVDAANRITRGDYHLPPLRSRCVEVVELSEAMSNMASSIRDLNQNLNQKIEQRTRELSTARSLLQQYGNMDSMTGLITRTTLQDQAGDLVGRVRNEKASLACLVIDVTILSEGEAVRDQTCRELVLPGIADYIKAAISGLDLAGLTGEQEFCVLHVAVSSGTVERDMMKFAASLLSELNSLEFEHDNQRLTLHCLAGVAMLEDEVADASELLSRADMARDSARHGGDISHVVLYSEGMKTGTE